MHIGINARTFTVNEPSGSVQIGLKNTNNLINKSNNKITLFGHDDLANTFQNVDIKNPLYLSKRQGFGVFWEKSVLPVYAEREGIDVLYSPNTNIPINENTSFGRVATLHDVNALKGMASNFYQVYRELIVPRTVSVADRIITVSEFSKSEINKKFNIRDDKISVVYNYVNKLFLNDSTGTPLDLPNKYVLFVGGLNPRKNIKRIIEAYINCSDKIPHKLVLIGPRNKNIFKKLNLIDHPKIHHKGFVTVDELKYAYNNADAFLFPSLYEGFGMPPLEAMACGCPVVASNSSSLPEVLGNAAHFVNPRSIHEISNGIMRIVNDSTYSDELINNGYKQAQKYTEERTYNETLQVIESASED